MRTVIYSAEDLEPITVIELAERWAQRLRDTGQLCLAVPEVPLGRWCDGQLPVEHTCRRVELRGYPLRCGRVETLIVITGDDESALLLRAAFLPGQRGAVLREREEAKGEGIRDFARVLLRLLSGEA